MASSDEHLTPDLLRRASAGALSPDHLAHRLLEHLRSVCPQCRAALVAAELAPRNTGPAKGGPAKVGAAHAGGIRPLSAWAEGIRRSLGAVPADGAAAVRWAREALAVADRLDAEVVGAALREDCRAVASAVLALSLAREAGPPAARRALALAETLLELGSGDPYAGAQVALAGAFVDNAEDQLRGAAERCDQAARLLRRAGDLQREGAARRAHAAVLARLGGGRGGIAAALDRGLEVIGLAATREGAAAALIEAMVELDRPPGG